VQMFHILQEALANVRRHSGARRARLRVERAGADVVFSVDDDGCGFTTKGCDGGRAAPRSSFGLDIMRERAEAIGARVSFENPPAGGARVVVRIAAVDPAAERPPTEAGLARPAPLRVVDPPGPLPARA